MAEYEVREGDWFAKIVKREGYGNVWRPIYNGADNADFRKVCPDPNLLIPGEICNLPDDEGKEETKNTDKKWKFEKAPSKGQLHVVLLRPNGTPLKSIPYTLVFHGPGVEGQTINKKTDASGAVKCEITTDVEKATLNIEGQSFELLIGHLEPVSTPKGVQARLQNLNYAVGTIDGVEGPGTPAGTAIKAFQDSHTLKDPEGVAAKSTQAKLKEIYGC
jgi:hypothetical protein